MLGLVQLSAPPFQFLPHQQLHLPRSAHQHSSSSSSSSKCSSMQHSLVEYSTTKIGESSQPPPQPPRYSQTLLPPHGMVLTGPATPHGTRRPSPPPWYSETPLPPHGTRRKPPPPLVPYTKAPSPKTLQPCSAEVGDSKALTLQPCSTEVGDSKALNPAAMQH